MSKNWYGKDNEHAGSIDEHGTVTKNDGTPIGWISGGIVYDQNGREIGEQSGSDLRTFNGDYIGSTD